MAVIYMAVVHHYLGIKDIESVRINRPILLDYCILQRRNRVIDVQTNVNSTEDIFCTYQRMVQRSIVAVLPVHAMAPAGSQVVVPYGHGLS